MRNLPVLFLLVLAGCGGGSAEVEGVRTINGTRLYVHEIGRGEPVIVVHGGPLLEHGYLFGPLKPLAEDYRLVFFDQRMSGRTPIDSAAVTMDALVEDIEALRAHIGVETAHILGHSWGGHLAMRYAVNYPERVRSMVLVSPMAGSTALWREEETEVAARVSAQDQADRQDVLASPAFSRFDPAAIEEVMRISFRPQVVDTADISRIELYFPPDYAERSQRFSDVGAALMGYDLHPALQTVDAPTLLIYGAIEPAANVGGLALMQALPNVRMEIIREAGHFSFVEQQEEFLRLVGDFLGVH